MKTILRRLKQGRLTVAGWSVAWRATRLPPRHRRPFLAASFEAPHMLHLGPGPNWRKPNRHWIDVDVDPNRADIVVDFQEFDRFPLNNASVSRIYGSHVFEHMSIWLTDRVFAECRRVLQPHGCLRMILPDVEKSIREYMARNLDFELFRRRRERARANYGLNYTLFDCLREDFLSRSSQPDLLGTNSLAHQNAWDFESIAEHLKRAGFSRVTRCGFQQSTTTGFEFEGTYPSEANEDYRSLYLEAFVSG